MNFYEQIMAALRTRFQGVEDAILSRIANKLAKTVTNAEGVQTAVDGVTTQQMLQSYGDSRATEAQQTAVHNYEAKYGLKDGEKINPQGGATPTPTTGASNPTTTPTGGAAADSTTNTLLQQLIEQNKQMQERLNRMDAERTTATRRQQLSAVIEKLPENLRKGYSRISVETLKDEEFNTLLGEVTTEVEELVKDGNAKGAVFGKPSNAGGQTNPTELTQAQKEAIAHRESAPVSGEAQPF